MRRAVVIILALLSLAGGCASRQTGPRKPEAKPWFDGRTLCALDMGDQPMPATVDQLRQALQQGAQRAFASTQPTVRLQTDGPVDAQLLHLSLTDVILPTKRRPPKINIDPSAPTLLHVERFEMLGDPIRVGPARVRLSVTADDACFERHYYENGGQPALVLADARHGVLQLSISKADMQAMLLQSAQRAASVVQTRDIQLDLTTDAAGHDVRWKLLIDTRIMLLPARLTITGRAKIDAAMYVTLSEMQCDGDQILGPLMASVVRPALARYNGRIRPLLSFGPKSPIRLRQACVRGGQQIELHAEFGNR